MTMLTRAVASLAIALLAHTACAKDVVIETPAGGINWTRGIVYAKGFGTAKPGLSAAQRRILSRRAAIVDGQRNLLEITRGVRINSVTSAGKAMQKSVEVATRVEGIIKGARPTEENYQNDVYSLTMVMPIGGDFLKVLLPAADDTDATAMIVHPAQLHFDLQPLARAGGALLDFLVPPASAAEPLVIHNDHEAAAYKRLLQWMGQDGAPNVRETLSQSLADYETNSRYSGLLIDASDVAGFELATIPKIRDEDGNVIYPGPDTSYDDVVNKRGVTYDFDLQDAVRNKRVATSPFVIKALSTYKNLASDLIIRKSDAARIQKSPSTVDAMNNAGVLIVVAI